MGSRKIFLSVAFVLILFQEHVTAQSEATIGKKYNLFSKELNEERSFDIYLLKEYFDSKNNYSLMIVLDGYFMWIAGIADYLAFAGTIPPMIIVSIDNVDREKDFTPTNSKNLEGEYIQQSGGAPKFLSFLEKELILQLMYTIAYLNINRKSQPQ